MFRKILSNRLSLRLGSVLLLTALLVMPLFASLPARAQGSWEMVASGLNNPRGLTFAPNGALYVAEAGTGGPNCYALDPSDPTALTCIGTTGSITRVWKGQQSRVVNGLVSLADPSGFGSLGPTDISFKNPALASIVVGLGADPRERDELASTVNPLFGNLGHLVKMVSPNNKWQYTADVSAYEVVANPDGEDPAQGGIDSNPYAVNSDGGKIIVADAGGNDLLKVMQVNNISTLAVFPPATWVVPDPPPFPGLPPPGTPIPVDAVPTSVVKGPDGYYYVGQLASISVDDANVYRIPPGGGEPEEYVSGLTAIIDVAFAPDGSLYVLEIFKNGLLAGELFGDLTGSLLHVATDGTITEIASEGLTAPGGLAVGPDGSIYVSNFSIFPGAGEVVRISPDYRPGDAPAAPSAAAPGLPSGSILKLFGIDLNKLAAPQLDFSARLPMIQR